MSFLISQVHFVDTFKFFLSLYGHKLPVLCMDISSDGDLIVTGSADKNIKIWGLDFGDCHKSIFAHADRCYIICNVDDNFSFFRHPFSSLGVWIKLSFKYLTQFTWQCYGSEVCYQYTLRIQCWKRSPSKILGC